MPACAVTSVNSIAPEGRGGVGLALGDGDAATTSVGWELTVGAGACLHAVNKKIESIKTRVSFILTFSMVPLRLLLSLI